MTAADVELLQANVANSLHALVGAEEELRKLREEAEAKEDLRSDELKEELRRIREEAKAKEDLRSEELKEASYRERCDALTFSGVPDLECFFGKAFGLGAPIASGSFGDVTKFKVITKLARARNGNYAESNLEIEAEVAIRQELTRRQRKSGSMVVVAPIFGIINGTRRGFITQGLDQDLHAVTKLDNWPNVLGVLEQLISLVHCLHVTLGYVHGDLKPSNLVLNYDGTELQACDLGHTESVDKAVDTLARGTVIYALPKQSGANMIKSTSFHLANSLIVFLSL